MPDVVTATEKEVKKYTRTLMLEDVVKEEATSWYDLVNKVGTYNRFKLGAEEPFGVVFKFPDPETQQVEWFTDKNREDLQFQYSVKANLINEGNWDRKHHYWSWPFQVYVHRRVDTDEAKKSGMRIEYFATEDHSKGPAKVVNQPWFDGSYLRALTERCAHDFINKRIAGLCSKHSPPLAFIVRAVIANPAEMKSGHGHELYIAHIS